jgi:predicted nucleotidyltransferase
LSGDFVQRGEPAAFSKHTRAEAAVRSGVDLAIELPLPWSLSSAEGFARGAVGLLGSLGVVTHLSFGSECGEIAPLALLTKALLDPAADAAIKAELQNGMSYAWARQAALTKMVGESAALLQSPNNILAVEYLKAIISQRLKIRPITILRLGAEHDKRSDTGFKSAQELRAEMARGGDVFSLVPEGSALVLQDAITRGEGPITMESLETPIISRLRILSEAAYLKTPGSSEGLGSRLCKAAWSQPTIRDILNTAKSKRYAMSRLRRMLMCAALGVTQSMSDGIPPYARVLALNERGRSILREIDERSAMPLIIKPATVRELGSESETLFELGSLAHDLYRLGYKLLETRRGGEDWRASPALVSVQRGDLA